MNNALRWLLTATLILLALVVEAGAAVWLVRQDGTGDFEIVRDAVQAAADGDIIDIGAGWYDDFVIIDDIPVYVPLDGSKSLTFRGVGADQTVIGPTEFQPFVYETGFQCYSAITSCELVFENLRIANLYHGIITDSAHLTIDSCAFSGIAIGIVSTYDSVGRVTVAGCEFVDSVDGGGRGIRSRASSTAITDCVFRNSYRGITINNNGNGDAVISRCTFDGESIGVTGISVTGGPDATIDQCVIRAMHTFGISMYGAGQVTITDCVIEQCGYAAVDLSGCDELLMAGNILRESGLCFSIAVPSDQETIRDNHFIRHVARDGYYIETPQIFPWGPFVEDFSGNYWGTTDLDEISAWILDGYAHGQVDEGIFIQFDPIAESPVRTEARSWSAVKSLFDDSGAE